MTNLRKSFILLSAAITMGNLEQAQAAAKRAIPRAPAKRRTVSADHTAR